VFYDVHPTFREKTYLTLSYEILARDVSLTFDGNFLENAYDLSECTEPNNVLLECAQVLSLCKNRWR